MDELLKGLAIVNATLTTLTKNAWSNAGQNLSTFDYALFGEHFTKVLVLSWSKVSQRLVN